MPLGGILSGDVLLVEFMYLVFTRIPGGSCRWSLHREERISGAVCHPRKSDDSPSVIAMISERGVVNRTK